MLYRVLERIRMDSGRFFEMGSVSAMTGVRPRVMRLLLEKNRIAEVQSPPLKILPGWEKRAELLEPLGIVDVGDLVVADLEQVAKELGVPIGGLQRAANEARLWVQVTD